MMKKPLREYLADLTEFVNVNRILRIGRRATKKAQEDNRRMGIPNVYSINGQLYYELPNGELTTEDPMADQLSEDEAQKPDIELADEGPSAEQRPNASSTQTIEADEETIKPPKTSHVGQNGEVTTSKAPAAVSDRTVDSDQ